MKTRLQFDEDELLVLMSWIYGDFKPQELEDTDKKIIKKLKSACKRVEREDLITEFFDDGKKIYDEFGSDITEEFEEKKKQIEDVNGIFYCEKCKVRTDQKTYTTKCVICNGDLIRVAR